MCFGNISEGIVFTGLFKALKDAGFKVYIVARHEVVFLYKENKDIAGVYDYGIANYPLSISRRRKDIIRQFGFNDFDIMIDLMYHPYLNETIKIMYAFKSRHRIIVNSHSILDAIADQHIRINDDTLHISQRSRFIMDYLQVKGSLPDYQVTIDEPYLHKVRQQIAPYKDKFIVCFNPHASQQAKSFNDEQVDAVLQLLSGYENLLTVVIGEQEKIRHLNTGKYPRVLVNTDPSYFVAGAIVKLANLVISPDTSIVHLCHAFDKQLICFYTVGYQSQILWQPFYNNATQIIADHGVDINRMSAKSIIEPIRNKLDEMLN